jgi:hypothetical protein
MRPAGLVAAIAASLAIVAACSKTEGGEPTREGQVRMDGLTSSVIDAECAEPAEVLYGSGVGEGAQDDRLVVFDVAVTGEEAEATVRVIRGDEVEQQFLASGATASTDGDEITVEGTFTEFDGPEQVGEVEGTVRFTCEPDTDPGGGMLLLDGQEVSYDLVTCLETPEGFEARARDTADADQVLTLRRALLASGWVDDMAASGAVALDVDRALDTGEGDAVDVEGGLFTVRGTRVTADGEVFGEGRVGSIDLTCGIDLTTVTED